jgi:malate synthase
MAGMNAGELSHGAPIGGMAAVMIYPASDPYGRSKYNPLALRAMVIDKLRERLLGLIFVPEQPLAGGQHPTLEDIVTNRVKGRLYDAYRQSWGVRTCLEYQRTGDAAAARRLSNPDLAPHLAFHGWAATATPSSG